MANGENRIARIERMFGVAQCICGERLRALEIVVVENGWDEERIRLAERAKQFVSPSHGRQTPRILRLRKVTNEFKPYQTKAEKDEEMLNFVKYFGEAALLSALALEPA